MHMADALLSPAVGGTMIAVSAGILGYSIRDIRKNFQEKRIPLMGIAGAFVFAAQMINFAIPGSGIYTGSRTVNTLPRPGSLSRPTEPPCAFAIA